MTRINFDISRDDWQWIGEIIVAGLIFLAGVGFVEGVLK